MTKTTPEEETEMRTAEVIEQEIREIEEMARRETTHASARLIKRKLRALAIERAGAKS